MHRSIWARALEVVANGLVITLLAWLLIHYFTLISKADESTQSMITTSTPVLMVVSSSPTSSLDIWIDKLGGCESHNNPDAYNPKDLDGTPSYGRFQFKIGTWTYFIKKYNLFGWQNWESADFINNIWDGTMQQVVVSHMVADPTVNLHHQFPDCTRKLGLPKIDN